MDTNTVKFIVSPVDTLYLSADKDNVGFTSILLGYRLLVDVILFVKLEPSGKT
ncbi:hypothetical protein CLOHAE12215_00290 [Clostridium haemolyticum]|nr:hypothetical protein CLOHAE12215_00290 [Clostridium haemolyticum]